MASQLGTINRPLILGIDPGLHGAVAVLDTSATIYGKPPRIEVIYDMPTYKTETKARKQGYFEHINAHELAFLLDPYARDVRVAILEAPNAMPEQGLSSTFRFGHACGQIHGVLAGFYIPIVPVTPGSWKAYFGLSQDKTQSMVRAREFFPESAEYWRLKKHNDRAEAALMAMFGFQFLK